MNTLNANKTALTVGFFVGGLHILWSLVILIGFAQPMYDFILWAHMIHLAIVIGPFDIVAAVVLAVMTFVIGYVLGWAFAYLWNRLHQSN